MPWKKSDKLPGIPIYDAEDEELPSLGITARTINIKHFMSEKKISIHVNGLSDKGDYLRVENGIVTTKNGMFSKLEPDECLEIAHALLATAQQETTPSPP